MKRTRLPVIIALIIPCAFSVIAKTKEEKQAEAVSEGVWMYQMTEKGLPLELTGKGTRCSKDDDLN